MIYTVILNGQSYDLPKKTMAVWTELDKTLKIDEIKNLSLRDKYKKVYDFIGNLLGHENMSEIFGSNNLDEIDLNELALAIKKIKETYEEPLKNYQMEQNLEAFNRIPLDKLDKIAGLTNLVQSASIKE